MFDRARKFTTNRIGHEIKILISSVVKGLSSYGGGGLHIRAADGAINALSFSVEDPGRVSNPGSHPSKHAVHPDILTS